MFKVGDRVRVKDDVTFGNASSKYCGHLGSVTRMFAGFDVAGVVLDSDGIRRGFAYSELELIPTSDETPEQSQT